MRAQKIIIEEPNQPMDEMDILKLEIEPYFWTELNNKGWKFFVISSYVLFMGTFARKECLTPSSCL
jgi:hypothetical protein